MAGSKTRKKLRNVKSTVAILITSGCGDENFGHVLSGLVTFDALAGGGFQRRKLFLCLLQGMFGIRGILVCEECLECLECRAFGTSSRYLETILECEEFGIQGILECRYHEVQISPTKEMATCKAILHSPVLSGKDFL
ncbi:hypothetical protein DdX_14784 [Ditylenchus destructor]|uniref:Uncharacterized protein n=1 Tax=Ditylenchus destructor TaxID=166010 RepID=A0AAD4R1L5_9BILA|nr:hypothetical protein DdX_14784 [Ditylenchus destructor]